MKKFSATLVFTLIIGVAALAYGKSKPLADQQMDRISAGSAVADGESTATDSRSFDVSVGGSSLSGAGAVDIVNSADSTVANGVNTWAGKNMNNGTVTQTNTITQTGVPCDCGTPGADVGVTQTKDEVETDSASANAIALDGSTATDKTEESVDLSGSAEANANAVNIVNAAGSIVGNGVNVASSTNMNNVTLIQANVITQSAH